MKRSVKYWLIAAGIVLIVFYLQGAFDRALAPVGLNRHSCIETTFGAIKCGDAKAKVEAEVETAASLIEREYRKEHPTPAEEWTPPTPAERAEQNRQHRADCAMVRSMEREYRRDHPEYKLKPCGP